ncbi:hypothetical protein JVT61DRAFT_2100 [Boletus reticuloceps]|uniref:Uncharacterized protein n=1 Tax=Boletus reticuloceps TaxID=495285 RepID=A0A8I2YRJ1_9AGAM|nr:hypothetical protein JVT61DRAFT_2100 [Boletus reticuloceps]
MYSDRYLDRTSLLRAYFWRTKTEECGRKLRDVARVCQSKITGTDVSHIPAESVASIPARLTYSNPSHVSQEVEQQQTAILLTEEALLEALCFDFVTISPHVILVDLFDTQQASARVQDYAWSLAHDSYRTPLCIFFPPRIIAAACFILAQRVAEGPHSPSLDARISASPPSASLLTPPSHKPSSPDASRFAIDYFGFSEPELRDLSDALSIMLEFYSAQDPQTIQHVPSLTSITPPTHSSRTKLYEPFSQLLPAVSVVVNNSSLTPVSVDGNTSPSMTPSQPRVVKATLETQNAAPRLDLT